MAEDISNSSSDTISYEDHFQDHRYPLSLVRGGGGRWFPKEPVTTLIYLDNLFRQVPWLRGADMSSFRRIDSFDEFLNECFDVSASNSGFQRKIVDRAHSEHSTVAQSLLDFDVSLLSPPSESVALPNSTSEVITEEIDCRHDSLQLRISDLKEWLGVYQFDFWRVTASHAIATIVFLCRKVLNLGVSASDFVVVHLLYHRKGGVVLRVNSLELKRVILSSRAVLRTCGFHVDFA